MDGSWLEKSLMKKRLKEVIVVEGRDDSQRLKQFYQVKTIETNGSAINQETMDKIKQAQDLYGVIVFTDPDVSGEKIRRTIMRDVPEVQHAFLERQDAKPKHKGSLGVEHASFAAIDQALSAVYTVTTAEENQPPFTRAELMQLGLLGGQGASARRDYLTQRLKIGHSNGKQLAKRLALFQIPPAAVLEVVAEYNQKEKKENHYD